MHGPPISAEALPDTGSKKTGVRRVNNVPLYIVGAVLTLFIGMMAIVAVDRAARQGKSTDNTQDRDGNAEPFAHEIVGKYKDGIVPAASEQWPEPEVPSQTDAEQNFAAPPLPTHWSPPPLPAQWEDSPSEAVQDPRQKQKFEEALHSKIAVPISIPRRSSTVIQNSRRPDGQLTSVGPSAQPSQTAVAQDQARNPIDQFNRTPGSDRWTLDSQLEAPRTPYELRAGFVIPATLISGINSDLPGQILGQVTQNVYDTATGKYLLVPQGARLVGRYSSDVAYGQARILVAWQRIVFPDGKAMDIGAMPGADSAGYAGLKDQVDNHYVRVFASAILMSGITAGVTYSQRRNQGNSSTQDMRSAFTEALGQQLGQTSAQIIAKNLNISPTLEIRPGFRFNVIVTKDMTFPKPYQSFDYQS